MAMVKYPGGKFGGRSGVKNISMLTSPKKHDYIIKAGDSRATRTLVLVKISVKNSAAHPSVYLNLSEG